MDTGFKSLYRRFFDIFDRLVTGVHIYPKKCSYLLTLAGRLVLNTRFSIMLVADKEQ
jgi:hypothetical protein